MGSHLIEGEFQSDKYPTTPRGKVPLSVKDTTAQDLLWEYAQRRRSVDAEFSDDLEAALLAAGYESTEHQVVVGTEAAFKALLARSDTVRAELAADDTLPTDPTEAIRKLIAWKRELGAVHSRLTEITDAAFGTAPTAQCDKLLTRLEQGLADIAGWAKQIIDWDRNSEVAESLPALLDAVELDLNAEHDRAVAAEEERDQLRKADTNHLKLDAQATTLLARTRELESQRDALESRVASLKTKVRRVGLLLAKHYLQVYGARCIMRGRGWQIARIRRIAERARRINLLLQAHRP